MERLGVSYFPLYPLSDDITSTHVYAILYVNYCTFEEETF